VGPATACDVAVVTDRPGVVNIDVDSWTMLSVELWLEMTLEETAVVADVAVVAAAREDCEVPLRAAVVVVVEVAFVLSAARVVDEDFRVTGLVDNETAVGPVLVVDERVGHRAARIWPLKMRPRRVLSATTMPPQRRLRSSWTCVRPVRQLLEQVVVARKSSVEQPVIAPLYVA
jgi:hypothetical protein